MKYMDTQIFYGRLPMNNSALKRLLTNGGRFKPDHPDYRRANLLNILSILYIAIAVVFAGLNFILWLDTKLRNSRVAFIDA